MNEQQRWFLVNSKVGQEKIVQQNLFNFGLEVFSPQLKSTKIIRRKEKTTVSCLFPGYLFVKFNPQHQYRLVNYAYGVRGVVKFGETIARVDEEIIKTLRNRSDEGYVILARREFTPGQRVHITQGPLMGFDAIFDSECSNRDRVIILLRTVEYQAKISIPIDDLVEKID